jgi:hypothetical protein
VQRVLPVSVSKEQVKNSPDIDTDQPVSRQHEIQYFGYYGYPYYWGGTGLWAGAAYPGAMLTGIGCNVSGADYVVDQAERARAQAAEEQRQDDSDPFLRSCNALLRYHIEATDWAIRYLIVETSNWWFGHQVLISPQWIEALSWPDATITVNVTRAAVRAAPDYRPSQGLNRDHEIALYRHHGRAGYWAKQVELENPEFHLTQSASAGPIHKYT